jgi:DNA helicase-2/ATP-dependent DNA helicase PcrA
LESDPQELTAVAEALRPLAARSGTLEEFLSELAMASDVDLLDPRADRIALLTLHAAKGLEFPVVFIVGCEDGLLPLRWGAADEAAVDEERRLFFVGMTRAERRLHLVHARQRAWMGKLRAMQPSPFLRDIEEELAQRTQSQRRLRRDAAEQLPLL